MVDIDVVSLLGDLVQIPSVNPTLQGGGGELMITEFCASTLQSLGFEVEYVDVEHGRRNVLGWLPGDPDDVIIFESHLDTVPDSNLGCSFEISEGRMWGRGTCDTKSSAAAMIAALARVALGAIGHVRPTLVFAGVVDEEALMKGAAALASRIPHARGIIIGEPTELIPLRAHNGILRFSVMVFGESAHTSLNNAGVNAVVIGSQLVTEFEAQKDFLLQNSHHQLTNTGAFTVTHMMGGLAPNVVPDVCELKFDRRLVPGERLETVLAAFDQFLDDLIRRGFNISRGEPSIFLPPVETDANHPLVLAAERACSIAHGRAVSAGGATFCTDASILSGGSDIPCVVLGPGSIAQAHSPNEWVELAQVGKAVEVYLDIITALG